MLNKVSLANFLLTCTRISCTKIHFDNTCTPADIEAANIALESLTMDIYKTDLNFLPDLTKFVTEQLNYSLFENPVYYVDDTPNNQPCIQTEVTTSTVFINKDYDEEYKNNESFLSIGYTEENGCKKINQVETYTVNNVVPESKNCYTNLDTDNLSSDRPSSHDKTDLQNNIKKSDNTVQTEKIVQIIPLIQVLEDFKPKKSPIILIEELIRVVLYYRYNLSYFFECFFLKFTNYNKRFNKELTSVFLKKLTCICLQFSRNSSSLDINYNKWVVEGVDFEQLKADEVKLIEETKLLPSKRNLNQLKNEIIRIKHYNKATIAKIKQDTMCTPFTEFKKEIKNLMGRSYTVEKYYDMFCLVFFPLYELSVIFDRPENKLLHVLISNPDSFHTTNCLYNKSMHCHHLFHWTMYWCFSFSSYNLVDYFMDKNRFFNLKKIPNNFFVHLIIIIYYFEVHTNESFILDIKNLRFLQIWEENIFTALYDLSDGKTETLLNQTIGLLLENIKNIFDPKMSSSSNSLYLRIVRTGEENVQRSYVLSPDVKIHLKKILALGKECYEKTKKDKVCCLTN